MLSFQSYQLDASCIQIATALKFTRDNKKKNYQFSREDDDDDDEHDVGGTGPEREEDIKVNDGEEKVEANIEDQADYYEEVVTTKSKQVMGLWMIKYN